MNWTKNKPTSSAATVVCAAIAEPILKQAGFTVQNLDGAYSLYKMANPEGVEYGN